MPSDAQKAALVDQFISVQTSYASDPVSKLIREIYAKFKGNTTNPEIVKEAREENSNIFDIYEKLSEGKDYIAGEFSLADILHCSSMQYIVHTGQGDLFAKRPNISRWWKNIGERECWKNTMDEYPFKAV